MSDPQTTKVVLIQNASLSKSYILIGKERLGPFDTPKLAEDWAQDNLARGKTYSVEEAVLHTP